MNDDVRPQDQQDAALERMLDDLFTYHAPTPEQVEKYAKINEAVRAAARVILQECPPNPDRTAAIRLLREARMTANASIATKSGGMIEWNPLALAVLASLPAQGPLEIDIPASSEGAHGQ